MIEGIRLSKKKVEKIQKKQILQSKKISQTNIRIAPSDSEPHTDHTNIPLNAS